MNVNRTRSRAVALLPWLIVFGIVAAFFAAQVRRLPFDPPLSYDESTHFLEGNEFADLIEAGDTAGMARYFLVDRVMKGILYRVWYGVGFVVVEPEVDAGRTIALVACCFALLTVFLLARALAPPPHRTWYGMLAALLAACSPLLVTHGRQAMVEPINLFTIALALFALIEDKRRRTWPSAVLAAIALLLAFATKYNHAIVLLAAYGADVLFALRERWSRPWRERLRPALPLFLALAPFLVFLANPERIAAVWYYIWTIPGGHNPVDFMRLVYVHTLFERMAPTIAGGVVVLLLAVGGAIAAWRTRIVGARLVVLHVAIGLALAQSNDLKLERILMPLTGGYFALAAVGAYFAFARLAAIRRGLAVASAAIAAVMWMGVPPKSPLTIEKSDLRPTLEAWLDEGLEFSTRGVRTLWFGGDFGGGLIWNTATLRMRVAERGLTIPSWRFEYGGPEFFRKSGVDPETVRRGELTDAKLLELLHPYDQLVVVRDPSGAAPAIRDAFIRRIFTQIENTGWYAPVGEARPHAFEQDDGSFLRARIEYWRRRR
jgi:hypothetical protein